MDRSVYFTGDARLCGLSKRKPSAAAHVVGSKSYPGLEGVVRFYQEKSGVYVVSSFTGLPVGASSSPASVFAMHIHNGGSCTGNQEDPFADAGSHYNPGNVPHPSHAGDLLPLFGNDGRAWSAFLTNRFTARDILGKVVIVHAGPDDFTTQPSGNAGAKIACGIIRPVR